MKKNPIQHFFSGWRWAFDLCASDYYETKEECERAYIKRLMEKNKNYNELLADKPFDVQRRLVFGEEN